MSHARLSSNLNLELNSTFEHHQSCSLALAQPTFDHGGTQRRSKNVRAGGLKNSSLSSTLTTMRPPEPHDSATTGSQGRMNHISSTEGGLDGTDTGLLAVLECGSATSSAAPPPRLTHSESLDGPAFCFWTNASRYLEQAPPCRGLVNAFQWAVFPFQAAPSTAPH